MNNNVFESMDEYTFFENNESLVSSLIEFPNNILNDLNNINMNNIYEEDNYGNFNNINNIESYFLINKSELEKKNTAKDTKSSSTKESEESREPKLYTLDDILDILNKEQNKDIYSYLSSLKFEYNIENNLKLTKKKRMRPFDSENIVLMLNNNSKNEEKKKKRGRKSKDNINREIHDKRSPDNIIKKIKVVIFKYTLLFLNKILKENFKYEIQLLKLDYQLINRIEKEQELNFLNLSLKDLFSKNISPKYKNKFPNDYNKKKIEKILKDAEDIVLFAFNMTLRDWLDIFTQKRSVKDIVNKYNNNNIDFQDLIEKIEQSVIGFDEMLKKINENNDEDYMTLFICYLYNYERWFCLKKCRKRNIKEKEIE